MRRRDFLRTLVASGAAAALGTLPTQIEGPRETFDEYRDRLWAHMVRDARWPQRYTMASKRAALAEAAIDTAHAVVQACADIPPGPALTLTLNSVCVIGQARFETIMAQPLEPRHG